MANDRFTLNISVSGEKPTGGSLQERVRRLFRSQERLVLQKNAEYANRAAAILSDIIDEINNTESPAQSLKGAKDLIRVEQRGDGSYRIRVESDYRGPGYRFNLLNEGRPPRKTTKKEVFVGRTDAGIEPVTGSQTILRFTPGGREERDEATTFKKGRTVRGFEGRDLYRLVNNRLKAEIKANGDDFIKTETAET